MKIGYIILCRYNSKRLPGKILRTIHGKPIIMYIVDRLLQVCTRDELVIATSNEATDDPIATYCAQEQLNIYRGSLNNVSERFLKTALKFNFDFATRINGDNFFADIPTMKAMREIVQTNKYDFVSNLKDRTYPKGMSVETVRTSLYEQAYQQFTDEGHYEHVTPYLYENEDRINHYYYYNTICPEAGGLQLAIDEDSDFELAEKIISKFTRDHTEYDLQQVYHYYKEIKNESV